MLKQNALVTIYSNPGKAQEAVIALAKSGFDLERLSVAGKAYRKQKELVAYYREGDHMKCWGDLGDFWNGIATMIRGWALLRMPERDPFIVVGQLALWIVVALDNSAIFGGLSAFGATLYSMGFSKNSVHDYEEALRKGNYLVVIHGPAQEVTRAKKIFQSAEIELTG
jgi:hypothetical protein